MTIEILGKGRRRKYNPDLGHQVNEEFERAKAKGGLDRKLRTDKPDKVGRIIEEIVEQYGKPDFGINPYKHPKHDEIAGAFKVYMGLPKLLGVDIPTDFVKSLGEITKRQIYDFSFYNNGLVSLENNLAFKYNASLFLSALMQVSKDEEFILYLNKTPEINFLGGQLENKKVLFKGDVGNNFADKAMNCVFYVEGDAGEHVAAEATICTIFIESKKAEEEGLDLADNIGRRTRIYLMDSEKGKYRGVWSG